MPYYRSIIIVTALLLCISCAPVKLTPSASIHYASICQTQLQAMQHFSVAPNHPAAGFWRNQYCIAEQACAHREEFQQPLWLDHVLERFIQAYTRQTRFWYQVLQHCEERSRLNPLRNLLCQRDMAYYHIYKDLPLALAKAGCSNSADWQRLEEYIHSCIQHTDYPPLISQYIQNRMVHYRTEVRNQCLANQSKNKVAN